MVKAHDESRLAVDVVSTVSLSQHESRDILFKLYDNCEDGG